MAAIYDAETGDEITDGLQGCDVCDEAIIQARREADERGESVHLVDDDGEWLIHPKTNGVRKAATPIESEANEDESDE